jgi:hypothetical protein
MRRKDGHAKEISQPETALIMLRNRLRLAPIGYGIVSAPR